MGAITKEPYLIFSFRSYYEFAFVFELILFPLIITFTLLDLVPSEKYHLLLYIQGPHVFSWMFVLTVAQGISDKMFLVVFALLEMAMFIIDGIAMIWRLVVMLSVDKNHVSDTTLAFGWVIFALSACMYFFHR